MRKKGYCTSGTCPYRRRLRNTRLFQRTSLTSTTMSHTSVKKALDIPDIVRKIVLLIHDCNELHCMNTIPSKFYYDRTDEDCGRRELVNTLFDCILVSRLWASVGIPLLWGDHATFGSALHLLTRYSRTKRWSFRCSGARSQQYKQRVR